MVHEREKTRGRQEGLGFWVVGSGFRVYYELLKNPPPKKKKKNIYIYIIPYKGNIGTHFLGVLKQTVV